MARPAFRAPEYMTSSSEAHSPQRHATRAPVERRVRLQIQDTEQVIEGLCRNISIGGMFVFVDPPARAGSTVRFEIELEEGLSIRGLAEVMWARENDGGPGREPGCGLRFKFLEQRDRQQIFKLVSRHIKERLADRHVPVEEPDPRPADLVVPAVVSRPAQPTSGPPDPPAPPPPPAPDAGASAPDGSEPARASLFDPEAGLQAPTPEPQTSEPAAESVLPDDWDDDPTAFRMPSEDPAPEPAPPAAPSSFEAELSALSDVLQSTGGSGGSLDLPLDPEAASEPDLPLGAGGSDTSSDPYLQHLGEDHFEHRPAPKKDLPVLPIAALVLVLMAALTYLFSDQLFDWAHADVPVEAPASAGPAGEKPAAEDPAAEAAPGPEEEIAGLPARSAPEPTPGPRQESTPPRRPAAEPSPGRPAPSSSSAPGAERAFSRLADVKWEQKGQGIEVILVTNGAVDPSRVDHFRLDGDSVREVIRVLGVDARYNGPTLKVEAGGVQRIRFGWHKKARGNEIHLVLDMADKSRKIRGVRTDGRRFVIDVGP